METETPYVSTSLVWKPPYLVTPLVWKPFFLRAQSTVDVYVVCCAVNLPGTHLHRRDLCYPNVWKPFNGGGGGESMVQWLGFAVLHVRMPRLPKLWRPFSDDDTTAKHTLQ